MDLATEKQLNFMKTLGMQEIPNLSKQAAKELISAKLAEDEKPEVVRPSDKPKTSQNGSKSFTTMYVSYAKDLIVSGKTPEEAIGIISALKEEFE